MSIRYMKKTTTEEMNEIKELLSYDSDSGVFTWRKNYARKQKGSIAGSVRKRDGYIKVTIKGKIYSVHRLAWLLHYGSLPNLYIDHIDNNRQNNKISNLRLATNSQNQQNAKTRKDSKSGYKGVFYLTREKRWTARIRISKTRQIQTGTYDTPEEAYRAYCNAADLYFKEFSNHGL